MKEILSQLSMSGASSKSSKSSLTLQTYNRTGILPVKQSDNKRNQHFTGTISNKKNLLLLLFSLDYHFQPNICCFFGFGWGEGGGGGEMFSIRCGEKWGWVVVGVQRNGFVGVVQC